MKKIAILVVMILSGCFGHHHKEVTNQMAQLRSPKGMCVTTTEKGAIYSRATVCFLTGTPEQPNDDGTTPFISLRIDGDRTTTDLASWRMTVKKGNRVVYAGSPVGTQHLQSDLNSAFYYDKSTALVKASEPWSPGAYDVEVLLTTSEMGRHAHTMTMTLIN